MYVSVRNLGYIIPPTLGSWYYPLTDLSFSIYSYTKDINISRITYV